MANPIKVKACVKSIESFGDGVYKLELLPEGRVPRFKPGQFLHLTVDEYDPAGGFWPESRVFSIASGYGKETLTIIYSVKGKYTKRMEESLAEGKEIWLKLPYGSFTIDIENFANRDIVLVAGGTGVSPFVPFLEALPENGIPSGARIALYYGARKRAFIMFRQALAACARLKGFSLSIKVEDEDASGLDVAGAKLANGRLDIKEIYATSKELREPIFYLSGPPVMIKAFKGALADAGVANESIKIDEWE